MKNQNDPVDVVYKFVDYKRFYPQMDKYLGGDLFFADWHSFTDKREGKYLCSSSVRKDLRDEIDKIKEKKYRYRVCSTTLGKDIFELWDRYLVNSPAICLAIKIEGLNTTNKKEGPSFLNGFVGKEFTGYHVDYTRKLKSYSKLEGKDDEEKAVEILTTKKNHYFYEEEYRLLINNKEESDLKDGVGIMHPVGEVIGVIIGGCCLKEDSGFNRLRKKVLDKHLCFQRAYIDFSLESVKIEDDVCSVNDLMNRAPRSRITP